MKHVIITALLLLTLMIAGCGETEPVFETELAPLHTDLNYIKDAHGRYMHFRGTNVGGSTKVPVFEPMLDVPLGKARGFSYVGRPFAPGKEDQWFAQLQELGFNSIRLLFIWEAVFPDKKGEPDEEFLDYFRLIISKANEYGIYVLLNMHENLWSRHLYSLYNEDVGDGCDEDAALCLDDIVLPLFPKEGKSGADRCKYTEEVKGDASPLCEFSDRVAGDGAPLWATKICLPEKNFDSGKWGMHRMVGRIDDPLQDVYLDGLNDALKGMGMDATDLIEKMKKQAPENFDIKDSCDMLPWTFWGTNNAISLDVERCYASMFAGDLVYPNHRIIELGDGEYDVVVLEKAQTILDKLAEFEKQVADGELAADKLNKTLSDWLIENYPTTFDFYLVASDDEQTKLPVLPSNIKLKTAADVEDLIGIEKFLQDSFTEAWVEVAKVAADYPNVLGYDIMNEPASIFLLLTAASAYFDLGAATMVEDLLAKLLPDDNLGANVWMLLKYLQLIPTDTAPGTKADWGLIGADMFSLAGLNMGFGDNHLKPLFEKTGAAILDVYVEKYGKDYALHAPIIHLEPAGSIDNLTGSGSGGLGGQWMTYMRKPRFDEEKYGDVRLVWAPHWYPDIYPSLGFNQQPRQFTDYEYNHRDYTQHFIDKVGYADYALDKVPTIVGEFGTYWNFRYESCEPPNASNDYNPSFDESYCAYYNDENKRPENDPNTYSEGDELPGYEQSRYHNYEISTQILDNYYEAFEGLFLSNLNWCYTTDNDPVYGDWWNHEDFSIIDENGEPRGEMAYVRPYPKALSGKPVSMHFYSDYHYFDPDKGEPNATHEFELVMESKETDMATLIFVPKLQYPDGFYVWLSDGFAAFDDKRQTLHYYPAKDEPGWQHKVTIRPPIEGMDISGWNYFVEDGQVITAGGSL